MGNYAFRAAFNRENLSRIFMFVPRWLLPFGINQNKPLALPNVQQEEDSYDFPLDEDDDDDDSVIFCAPPLKQQTGNLSNKKLANKRRMTFSYADANSMHIHALTEEIKALRETVADLVSNSLNGNKNGNNGKIEEEGRENWKELQNEENFNIKRRRCKSFIEVKENLKNEVARPNLKEVLKDLRNVKLKPVPSSTPKRTPERDVRNDLHKILLTRFAAMHSPMFSTNSLSRNRRRVSKIGTDICHNDIDNCDSDSDNSSVRYEDSWL